MGIRTFLGLKKSFPTIPPGFGLIERNVIDIKFPIDLVYTWVDGADGEFQESLQRHLTGEAKLRENISGSARFESHDELRYSLRSVENFIPWVNHVFILTNGQRPSWLKASDKISVVSHSDVLDEKYLPTFNSHVIESALHRIPTLSEHYVYLNDDNVILRRLDPCDFFTDVGLAYLFRSRTPMGGAPIETDSPGVWAIKNAAELIKRHWGAEVTLRPKHGFKPQRKSVATENERVFQADYEKFRSNKFRAPNDIAVPSILNSYAAYLTANGLFSHNKTRYVAIKEEGAAKQYEALLREKGSMVGAQSLCINDTTEHRNPPPNYTELLRRFLDEYFPHPSSFERII